MGEDARLGLVIVHVRVVISKSGSLITAARPLTNALQTFGSVFFVMSPGQTMVGGAAMIFADMKCCCEFLFVRLLSVYCELPINEFVEESGITIFSILGITDIVKLPAACTVGLM
jgi:hypothetical protein